MSLNSSSGSAVHPMTHRAKQQSMNAQRRNKNALKDEGKLHEVDESIEILHHSNNINNQTHFKIIDILKKTTSPNINSIFPEKLLHKDIITKIPEEYIKITKIPEKHPNRHVNLTNCQYMDENIIQRVEKGTYFEIGGVLYQVTDMLHLDGGIVEAERVFPENSKNITKRYTFSTHEVLHSMIPKSVVFDRIVQLNMKSGSLKKDYSDIQYMDNDGKMHPTMDDVRLVNTEIHKRNNPETKNNLIRNLYMDKNGNSHPTMDDVRSANDKILKKKYPERIKDTDLITKIQKPYFN